MTDRYERIRAALSDDWARVLRLADDAAESVICTEGHQTDGRQWALYPEQIAADPYLGDAIAHLEWRGLAEVERSDDAIRLRLHCPECSGDPKSCPENEGYGRCGGKQPEAQAGVAHATAAKDAEIEALRAEVAEARPSETGYRAGVFPGGIANPADVGGADSGDWYCEWHPESLQGHDGCEGAGMPSSARIPMLVHQVRMLMQELRERDLQYGFLARAALSAQAEAQAGGDMTDSELLTEFVRICREHKPVGQWPGERVCKAIERLLNPAPKDRFFIAPEDKAPLRGHNGRGGDADPVYSGPRTTPPPSAVPQGWPRATKDQRDQGWTLEYRFLERVTDLAAPRTEYSTSMEATEQVLIAALEVLATQHQEQSHEGQ